MSGEQWIKAMPATMDSGEIRIAFSIGDDDDHRLILLKLPDAELFSRKIANMIRTAKARGLLMDGPPAGSA